MVGDEVKAQLRRALERRPMNPAVRDRLCLDVSIMMRALGQVPNMDRPVKVQLHVHEERGHGMFASSHISLLTSTSHAQLMLLRASMQCSNKQ